jgi:hypothetical protein
MRTSTSLCTALLAVTIARSAWAQSPTQIDARLIGGGAYSDHGPGGRVGLEGDVWFRPTTVGTVGFGLQLAYEGDHESDLGYRHIDSGLLYLAFGADWERWRFFVRPEFGIVNLDQLDVWDGNRYQGVIAQAGAEAGAILELGHLTFMATFGGARFLSANPSSSICTFNELYPGGWGFFIDLGVGFTTRI